MNKLTLFQETLTLRDEKNSPPRKQNKSISQNNEKLMKDAKRGEGF